MRRVAPPFLLYLSCRSIYRSPGSPWVPKNSPLLQDWSRHGVSTLNFCMHPAYWRKKTNCDSLSQWFPLAAASWTEGYGFPEPGKASVSACRSSLVLLPSKCTGWIKCTCLQRPSSQLLPHRQGQGISLSSDFLLWKRGTRARRGGCRPPPDRRPCNTSAPSLSVFLL